MSFTNIPKVTCLVCYSKTEITSTKNIFKTTFAHNGKSLAPFVSITLALACSKLRSSYLCLQCLNLFGKLEEAQRKALNIKCEIHKIFKDSYEQRTHVIENANNNTPLTESQVSISSSKAITQCAQTKRTNVSDDANGLIDNNLIIFYNLETKESNKRDVEDNELNINLKLEAVEQNSNNDNISEQSNNEEVIQLDADSTSLSNDNKNIVVSYLSSLEDHQYGQLSPPDLVPETCPEETPLLFDPCPDKITLAKKQTLAMEIVKSTLESKKLKVPKPEYYTCPKCGKKTRKLQDLQLHYKTHSDFRPYMCDKCGHTSKTKRALTIHMRAHDEITPFICQICYKYFTQKTSLKKHMLIHTGEKPYECEICSKKYTHVTSYKMHLLAHSQKKAFKCDLCPIAFLSNSHLKRHMRVHTGEKRHSCQVCGKSFAERYNVISHMKIHDPLYSSHKEAKRKQKRVLRRRCERCNIDFSTMREYTVHLHLHTPENSLTFFDENRAMSESQLLEPCDNEVWQSLSTD